jgi:hypothetical protein
MQQVARLLFATTEGLLLWLYTTKAAFFVSAGYKHFSKFIFETFGVLSESHFGIRK